MMEKEIPSRLMFRDPLQILLANEARTCRGCIHQHTEHAFGVDVKRFAPKPMKTANAATMGADA